MMRRKIRKGEREREGRTTRRRKIGDRQQMLRLKRRIGKGKGDEEVEKEDRKGGKGEGGEDKGNVDGRQTQRQSQMEDKKLKGNDDGRKEDEGDEEGGHCKERCAKVKV
ncbi:hypothetical protein ACLOJK_039882 [Asimina triloba]